MDTGLERIDDRDRWRRLLSAAGPSVLQQGWAYGAALAHGGAVVDRLGLIVAGRLVGLVQVIGRRVFGGPVPLWHGLGGPSWLPDTDPVDAVAALAALRRRYGWRRGRLLLLTPATATAPALAAAGWHRAMTGYTTARLALRPGLDRLRAGLEPDWRRLLRKGPARDLDLAFEDPRASPLALDDAIRRELQERRRRGYAGLPARFVAATARRSAGILATASVDGAPVGQMLVLRHGGTATYLLGWTSPAGRRRYAHHHLLWGIVVRLCDAGCDWLDLGGLNVPAGIVRFKLATGAVPVTFAGTYA